VVTEDLQIAGPYTVQSVVRALRLVEIVADGPPDGLSLSEMSRALGTSKSSTLALARTLVASGYLRDAHPGPGYTLGTALLRLGDIVVRQLPLDKLCRPLIEDLSQATKMTARAAVNDEGYAVFVTRVDGPGGVRFYTPLGRRELPNACAAGKAILSTMDEDVIRRMCAETGLAPRTAHTITDVDTMLENLAVARRLGFAVDDEEASEGVICLGAAFFGHDGACAGAVSVTGIKGDLPAGRIDELGRTVRALHTDQRPFMELGQGAGPGVGTGAAQPGGYLVDQVLNPRALGVEVHPRGRDAFFEQFLAGPLKRRIGHRAQPDRPG
jgi:IclR family transcriptional regulator, acetate operon repressor